MIGLKTTWNSPHKGMLGTIASFYRKTTHDQAHNDREPSPQRYTRHNRNNHALYLFFFKYLLFIYRKAAHVQAHNEVEQSPQRYTGLNRNDHALFSFLFLNTYSFYRRLPMFGLTITWNCPHQGMPFFLFFFFKYLLFFPTLTLQSLIFSSHPLS